MFLEYLLIYNKLKKEFGYHDVYNEIMKDDNKIEKKYLINITDIPYNLKGKNHYSIEQTYINFSPEIRVRRI